VTDDVHARAERARDISITDFHFVMLPDGVLTDRSGRRYLTYGRSGHVTKGGAWALYTLCAAAANSPARLWDAQYTS
jgi:hypothetical protein